jgi:hypothetical protein
MSSSGRPLTGFARPGTSSARPGSSSNVRVPPQYPVFSWVGNAGLALAQSAVVWLA